MKQTEYTTAQLESAARLAFWGGNPQLSNFVADKLGYEMDGIRYQSNGFSLQECIDTVKAMTDDEFYSFYLLDIIPTL